MKGASDEELSKSIAWLLQPPTEGPRSILLLRLMAGGVFFWEGLLKFVYVNQGVGRFTKLGIPFPVFSANFVAVLEIGGGLLLLSGLATRLIAIPFIAEMIVAILTTKIGIFLGTSPLPLPPALPKVGLLGGVARDPRRLCADHDHHVSADQRAGKWSLDALLLRRWKSRDATQTATEAPVRNLHAVGAD